MIKFVIVIVIVILILSYFGFNLKDFFERDIVRNNLRYAWDGVIYVWDNYLTRPFEYLWNDVFINLIWNSFIENLKRIKGTSEKVYWATSLISFPY